jgi:hypothetical protein
MKIKMLIPISGVVESVYQEVRAGDVLDIDPAKAAGWIELKWAADVDQSTPITTARLRNPTAHS